MSRGDDNPMADSSFDIVSKVDRQEVDNALNQAAKELATRFDFRAGVIGVLYTLQPGTATIAAAQLIGYEGNGPTQLGPDQAFTPLACVTSAGAVHPFALQVPLDPHPYFITLRPGGGPFGTLLES